MLILSKFKDYYDIGTTYGIDKTIVFKRKNINSIDNNIEIPNSLIELNESKFKYHTILSTLKLSNNRYGEIFKKNKYVEFIPFILGFCNKLYLGYKKVYFTKEKGLEKINIEYEYDIDNILFYLKNEKDYYEKKTIKETIIDYKNIIEKYNKSLNDIFRKYNTPIFTFEIDGYEYNLNKSFKFTVNPILRDFQFYKLFDSYQTFQEISMFIGGVLGNKEKDMIEISNIDKINSHGYNKWSFRNPNPPKRKQKKNDRK